eukprot:10114868-Alexandrium_andersonii.AAC.1
MPEADKRSREALQNLNAAPWAWRQGPASVGAPEPQATPRAAQPEQEPAQVRALRLCRGRPRTRGCSGPMSASTSAWRIGFGGTSKVNPRAPNPA